MMNIEQIVPPGDETLVEQWQRLTEDADLLGVEAALGEDGIWRVVVSMAEFLREKPEFSELTTGVERALLSVAGVASVWHEDREQWVAEGEPSGRELVAAVAAFIDGFADRVGELAHGGVRSQGGSFVRVVLERVEDGWRYEFVRADGSSQVSVGTGSPSLVQAQNAALAHLDDDIRSYDFRGGLRWHQIGNAFSADLHPRPIPT